MKRLLLVLALIAGAQAKEGAPKPAPPSLPDFARLGQLYQEFGLPQPPAEAPLIRFGSGSGWMLVDGKQKDIFHLGFLLAPAKDRKGAEMLEGPFRVRERLEPGEGKPFSPDTRDIGGLSLEMEEPFRTNIGPALAVQCFQRGQAQLAAKILHAAAKVTQDGGPSLVSDGSIWREHRGQASYEGRPGDAPEVLLGGTAWSYWLCRITDPATPLVAAHEKMALVLARTPELNDPTRRELLGALAASLKPSQAAPGSAEAAIDELVNCTRRGGIMEPADRRDPRYDKLLLMGFDAVPALLAHLDDKRLTRSVMTGFNNFPTMPRRVNELVSDLLTDLLGSPAPNNAWLRRQLGEASDSATFAALWQKASAEGEETHLVTAALPPAAENVNAPPDAVIRAIAAKYPRRLPGIYRKLLDQRPDLQSWNVVEALAAADLPPEEKLRAFRDGAGRGNLALSRPALTELHRLAPEEADAILLTILQKLPKKSKAPVWTSPEAGVARLVLASTSDAVWAAFAAALKRAHVSLRLELLTPFNYSTAQGHALQQRCDLLSQFLDDATERVASDDEAMYDGPCAAFTYPKITVGNFAALQLGLLLGIGEEPRKDWSGKQWTAFREKVRAAR